MTTARIDWTTGLAPGARVIPVILIAGLPAVLTPAGILPTTVAVSSGTIDPLWWPGTGPLAELLPGGGTLQPVEDLLDPTETLEVFERASLLKGDVRVESLSFSVLDTDGRGTALLSNREGRITQLLASDITAAATAIPLVSSVGFPAGGIACIERETVTFIAVTGTDLTTVVRGKYGSHARAHLSPAEHRPLVVAGYPRHWQSRLATVWLCVLSSDGLTLTDPSLLYAGTVGAGVQMTGNLTRWTVPLDHVSVALTRKVDIPPISIYGYHHFNAGSTARAFGGEHPLSIVVGTTATGLSECSLLWDPASIYDLGGWHPTRESFVASCQAKTNFLQPTALVNINAALQVTHFGTNVNNSNVRFSPGWGNNPFEELGGNANSDNSPLTYTAADMPEAYFKMSDTVRIPSALDFARIPTTFQWTATTTDGVTGTASVALIADTVGQKGYTATIIARNDPPQTVRLAWSSTAGPDIDTRVLERTAVKFGVVATGASPIAALKAAALAIDALTGQDLFESAVDWDHLERLFMAPTSSLPQAREYRFTGDTDSFLDVLIDELRLRGLCMAIRYGLISAARLMSYADSEDTAASIVETDTLSEDGKEIPLEIVDNVEPLATGVDYSFPSSGGGDPIVISVTDLTYQSEFGDSARVECNALLAIPTASAPNLIATFQPLYAVAQQILGPLAEPSRAVRIPLTPVLLGLQPGDLVKLTHSRIPMWTGVRGIDEGVCQVQEVRRILFGGRLRATVVLRLQSAPAYGYAPEAIVTSGGITTFGTTVHLSAITAWGPSCHATDTTPTAYPTDGFAVGDVVVLSQLNTRTPIADVQRTIVSMDEYTRTVELSSAPGATMASAAAVPYGVILRYAPYDQCTARQQKIFAWIADQTTQVLGAADAPKRYTA